VDAEKREVDVGKRMVGYKKRRWMLEVVVRRVVHITVVVVKVTVVNINYEITELTNGPSEWSRRHPTRGNAADEVADMT
jgi:hypothetical protein